MDAMPRSKRRAQKWLQVVVLCTLGYWLLGFSTSRLAWPGLVRPFSDDGLVATSFRKIAHFGLGPDEDVERRLSPDKLWAYQLRSAVGHTFTHAFGFQGQALLLALASSLTLLRGGFLLAESTKPCQVASWFVLGAAISLCWVLHPCTAPSFGSGHVRVQKSLQFALAVACQGGAFFALFPEAAAYIVGSLASVMVQHIVQLTVALHVPNEAQSVSGSSHIDASWWQLSAGLLGGCLCLRFPKPALHVLASMAGSAGLAFVAHWWLCLALMLLRGDVKHEAPLEHVGRLLSRCDPPACESTSRWIFLILWAFFLVGGLRLQRHFELSKEQQLSQWYQDQIRKAPSDSNFVPHWPGQTCTSSPDLTTFQMVDVTLPAPAPDSVEVALPERSSSAPLHAVAPPQEEHDIYVPEGVEPPVLHRARTTVPVLQPVQESKPLTQYAASSSSTSPSRPTSPSASSNSERSLRRFSLGRGERNGRSVSASSLSSVEAAAILGLPPRSAFRKTPV
mmetsp:Transcript_111002/g.264856  ORF Transcript_111002/g.264856 Transcript_111002/m.264856 type:complete len:507 (-) Transcript_111002:151-1671(-)